MQSTFHALRVSLGHLALVFALVPAASAQVHDSDIILKAENSAIVTGYVPTGATSPTFPERVFTGEFGEFPNWTNDPGFDSESGSLPAGIEIGFDINRALRVWDGSAFTDIPMELIRISKSGQVIDTPPIDVHTPGFVIGSANGSGVFHHHPGYELLAPSSDGVYLMELTLWSTSPSVSPSDAIWIVFGQNSSPAVIDDAVAWVRANLIGAPCYADCDESGSLDFFDFLCFQNRFSVGDPYADCDESGSLDFFDFLCFQNSFSAGCP